MELTSLGGGVHVLHGSVNSGLVETERGLLAIDTGLDRGAANRIARAAEELGRPLVAILNTHAHADHHGGNAQLVRRFGIPVYAPAIEEATIRHPRLEPVYLFGGAEPVSGLANKFLQAEPSPVDHVGHAGENVTIDGRTFSPIDLGRAQHGQSAWGRSDTARASLRRGRVLWKRAAGRSTAVPYLVVRARCRTACRVLLSHPAAWYVPGHGEPENDARNPCSPRTSPALEARFRLAGRAGCARPASTEDLLVEFADGRWGCGWTTPRRGC
jgi:glyoxylase-like metal-dependent hydrolase (beta-lactamase superfamily II)